MQASRLVPNKVQTILLVAPFNLKCVGIHMKVWLNHRMIARSCPNFHNFPDYVAYRMRCIYHFGSKFSNRLRISMHVTTLAIILHRITSNFTANPLACPRSFIILKTHVHEFCSNNHKYKYL